MSRKRLRAVITLDDLNNEQPRAMLPKVDLPSEYMVVDPDVVLCFDDHAVLGHSQLLSFWSNVLRGAIQAGSGGACNGGGKGPLSIPMSGTSSTDWLKLVPFFYPGDQPEQVTWDNVEALLVLGDKYDIPKLASRALQFLKAHLHELNISKGSCRYIWKWVSLLDNAAAADGRGCVFEKCIQTVTTSFRDTCTMENMKGLSTQALAMLASALARTLPSKNTSKSVSRGWCPTCRIAGTPLETPENSPVSLTRIYRCSRCSFFIMVC